MYVFLNLFIYFYFFAVDLLGLLKWRSNTSLLQQNLRQLMKVDGGEVVKVCMLFLRDLWVVAPISFIGRGSNASRGL